MAPGSLHAVVAGTGDDVKLLLLRQAIVPREPLGNVDAGGFRIAAHFQRIAVVIAVYARLDIARRFPYNLKFRHSADVDWCIRIMKEAERLRLPLVNVNTLVANFEEGGDTTMHHRASLLERFHVMADHYGYVQTVLLHGGFVVRSACLRFSK